MAVTREHIAQRQLEKLNRPDSGLALLRKQNTFYGKKLEGLTLPISSLGVFHTMPFTTKQELVDDQADNPALRNESHIRAPRLHAHSRHLGHDREAPHMSRHERELGMVHLLLARDFQVDISKERGLWELHIDVEVAPGANSEAIRVGVAEALKNRLGIRATIEVATPSSLLRYELKARRFRFRTEKR